MPDFKGCVRCVLPSGYPGISFDEKGVCNFCRAHSPIVYRGEEALDRFLEPYRRSPAPHNCVVPLSGGKDSTYVLCRMKERFGMRPLAFHYDNSLTDPQAQTNIREVSRRLGIEVVSLRNERHRQYLRVNLKALRRRPSASMVTMLCNGCRYGIIGNAFRIARRRRIPLVVIGWSPIEDTPFKAELLKGDGGTVIRGLLVNLARNPLFVRPSNLLAAGKDYFHNYSHVKENRSRLLNALFPDVQLLQFYDYAPYAPQEIRRTVETKAGWKSPDPENSWQFDCKIKLFQSYYYEKLLGFTSLADYYSAMIREGLITWEAAIAQLGRIGGTGAAKLHEIHRLLDELGLAEIKEDFS